MRAFLAFILSIRARSNRSFKRLRHGMVCERARVCGESVWMVVVHVRKRELPGVFVLELNSLKQSFI